MNISSLNSLNVINVSNISYNIRKNANGMDDYTIVLLLCFSSIILIYMTRFIKPEPDDDENEDNKNNKNKKKLKINPYLPFISYAPLSPFSPSFYIPIRNIDISSLSLSSSQNI